MARWLKWKKSSFDSIGRELLEGSIFDKKRKKGVTIDPFAINTYNESPIDSDAPILGEIADLKRREYNRRNQEIQGGSGRYGRSYGYTRSYRRYPSRNYGGYGYKRKSYQRGNYKYPSYQRQYKKAYSRYGQGYYYRAYGTKWYGRKRY